MKKFFTKILASLLMIAGLRFAAQAQNIFFEETFDNGLDGWTIDTISNSGIDTLGWGWTPDGNSGPLIFTDGMTVNSASGGGAAFVNFENQSYAADLANVPPDPIDYNEYFGHLVSPAIDLSDATGPLQLSFDQFGRYLNFATNANFRFSVSFSADDGVTWGGEVDAFEGTAQNVFADERQTVRIPMDIGLQGNESVRIRFTYGADFYFWIIDDITLEERNAPNLRANENFFAIAPNYSTPAPMVEEFGFLVDIENIGGTNEENVNVNMTIVDEATNAVVFEVDQPYGTIAIDSLAENVPFGAFTPPATAGSYTATYTLTSDGDDADEEDNAISFDFEVTEDLFAKESDDNAFVGVAPNNGETNWSLGNAFYIPTEGYWLTDVTFGVENADEVVDQSVLLRLFRWEGDLNEDGGANEDEYESVTFNGYFFDGSENDEIITMPIDLDGNAIRLEAGNHYIVMIEYTESFGTGVVLDMLTTNELDYGAMAFRTDSLGDARYSALFSIGNDGDYFQLNGLIPPVRMTIADRSGVSSVEELADENLVQIFPNPTSDVLNINLDLIENADQLNVSIVDIAGKVHFTQEYDNIQTTTLEYDLRSYPSGAYIVYIETAEGIRSIPLAIQK